jgi:RNA polymerase sigma factor (sigma-70 family)
MRKAIRELTTKEQQLLFLRHHEDLRVKEIAAVFGVSSGRICQMYNAIITKLRSIMKIAQDEQALK